MAITKKGIKWELMNSLWILLSFIVFINGTGLNIAGKKSKVKKWKNYGYLYTAATWTGFIMVGENTGAIGNIGMAMFFISYFACIIHCFKIRKEYLLRLEILNDRNENEKDLNELRSKISSEYGVDYQERFRLHQDNTMEKSPMNFNATADRINAIKSEKLQAQDAHYHNIPLEERQMKAVDINSCSESELAELPGVGLVLAKKAVDLRNRNNGFSSVDDFIEQVGIKHYFVDRLKEMVCCNPLKNNENIKTAGRMVDF